MRWLLVRVAVLCLVATACRLGLDEDFPESAAPFVPPPQYRTWWEVVESCSGRSAPFEAVSWFKVPVGELLVRDKTAAGAWFVFRNRIAIANAWTTIGSLVRHEMLHAILETGGHPEGYFRGRCGDVVACSDDCQPPSRLDDAVALSPHVFEAEAALYPARPSLTAYGGRMTVVVTMRNPTDRNAYFEFGWQQDTRCAVGYMISSVADPRRSDIECSWFEASNDGRTWFRPGETRRMVFEVDLRAPTYGGRAFAAEPVTLSAIVVDNLRGTTALSLLP